MSDHDSTSDLPFDSPIHAVCDRFEAARRAAGDDLQDAPRVEEYLAAAGDLDRHRLARELAKIESDYQLLHGHTLDPIALAARMPPLTPEEIEGIIKDRMEALAAAIASTDGATMQAAESYGASRAWLPGDCVGGGRYRIVQLIGRGGMGEVYLADDLTVGNGKRVALKVVRDDFAAHGDALRQFKVEVRLAMEVTDAHVCRVYDGVVIDGRLCMSMEFIDGQSLDRVLAQAGPLRTERALQIADHICAGLAAAHAKGVCHRDLKPANILLDAQGKASITDFGLASLANDGDAVSGGTLTYMSPEQLRGGTVDAASDIYSLGLLLFELFTGRRVFHAATPTEALRERELFELAKRPEFYALDPAVRETLTACLKLAPQDRPQSVENVLSILHARPSLDRIKDWAARHMLSPALTYTCLAATLVSIMVLAASADRTTLMGQANPASPHLLRQSAQQIRDRAGHPQPVDFEEGYYPVHARSKLFTPTKIVYWYRESPVDLVPDQFFPIDYSRWLHFVPGLVLQDNPAQSVPGMVLVEFDERGRWLSLRSVPIAGAKPAPVATPDWMRCFPADDDARELLGAPWKDWQPASGIDPPITFDHVGHWRLPVQDASQPTAHITMAIDDDRLVYFQKKWDPPAGDAPLEIARRWYAQDFAIWLYLGLLCLACGAALWNIAHGYCDLRSAAKLASAVFGMALTGHLLAASHVPSPSECDVLEICLSASLYFGFVAWVSYVATEPHIRRYFPDSMISWGRLLAGRFTDPLIGRDLLVGMLTMVAGFAIGQLCFAIFCPGVIYTEGIVVGAHGARTVVGVLLIWGAFSIQLSLLAMISLVALRRILPQWGARIAYMLLWMSLVTSAYGHPILSIGLSAVVVFISVLLLERYGLLALMMMTGMRWLLFIPLSTLSGRWYFDYGLAVVLLLASLAVWGAVTSLRTPARVA